MFVTSVSNTKSKVLITGAIGDYGTGLSTDKNGKATANGNYEKISLQKGGFIVNATGLNAKLSHAKPTFNKATCSILLQGTGPGTLSGGTGAYKGIKGTLQITVTFAGVAPRLPNGQCNSNQHAKPAAFYQSVTAAGTVSFG